MADGLGGHVAACFHCGEAIPAGLHLLARVANGERAVCCIGCRGAVEWIQSLGLDDYYRLRSEPAPIASDVADYAVWDRPELQRLHVQRLADDRAEVTVLVDGIRCAACAWLIERAMGSSKGVCEVGVNAAARRVRLVFEPAATSLSALLSGLARLGYAVHPLNAGAIDTVRQTENRAALKRLVVAGLGAMQAMMYGVALYAGVFDGIDPAVRDFFRWLGLIVATPVVLYSASPFFVGAWREWTMRRLSMDTPVALAMALIYVASVIATIADLGEVYFDSVSMFVFFLLIGRYLEQRSRHRSGDSVDALARLQPAFAERRLGDSYETVGVHELSVGDCVRVGAGMTLPADGRLLSAECRVDESLLSGESNPRLRQRGDALIGGSIALQGPIELSVTAIGADSVLAGIVRLVSRAGMQRPQLTLEADQRAARFVLRVLIVTVATAVGWLWFDPSRAFEAALAVLVVSCPCAFALAAPAALTRAVAVLAGRGVLVVEADALERLTRADCFVFDKTGTVTEPGIDLASLIVLRGDREHALACAAALEQGSNHPLAQVVRKAADGLASLHAVDVVETTGQGVSGSIDGVGMKFGRADFAWPGASGDALVLADGDGEIARFVLQERVRPQAQRSIAQLLAQGVHCELLSGDHHHRVARAASEVGIADWTAATTPASKLDHIAGLQAAGKVVVMVGDGVNDAPVLSRADIAIAIGDGAALAHAHSGILLADGSLDGVMEARAIAAQMMRILRLNLRWALIYNLSVVPMAAFGMIPPWLAALGMSASSLLVILHTLRIGRGSRIVATQAPEPVLAALL